MAKVLERKFKHPDDMFAGKWEPAPLSATAAGWVDRIYRQIVRDGRYCQAPQIGDTGGLRRSSSTSGQPPAFSAKEVRIEGIGHEHSAILGPLLPGKAAWESLRLSECLRELGFSENQVMGAAASVMARLVEPSSEHALVQWIPTSALPELLGEGVLEFDHKRFYRISDKLLENREALEAHLRQESRRLFETDRTIILYDLTNTYFEGQALANRKARRGKSKEKRHDRPLVVLGMVYDGSGFALGHKTFAGNTHDGQSLVEMVEELKACSEPARGEAGGQMELEARRKPLVVVDAGVATKDNLVLLREAGFSYLVNDTRSRRSRYRRQFAQTEKFQRLKQRAENDKKSPVEVRMLREPAAGTLNAPPQEDAGVKAPSSLEGDTILLCHSHGRRDKEEAMFSKAEERFVKEANKLDQRLRSRRLTESKKIQQALGRLKAQNPRVQRYYVIELRDEHDPGQGLVFERKDREIQEHRDLFGCYVLRTDRKDFSPEQLWSVYISLTQAEEGFRALKSDLGLRPNFHHKQDRVDGHIFITIMAFHLWRWIRRKLDSNHDTRDWVTVRRILSTHCYATLVVPCQDGEVFHLRRPGQPEAQQRTLYQTFGITLSNLVTTKVKFRQEPPNQASFL